MFIVISLRYLPLATVITVLQVTPLAVTAGAAIIYRERVGWRRWLAALTGFLGVVLIVRPGGGLGAAVYLALVTPDLHHHARPHNARPAVMTSPRSSSPRRALPPSLLAGFLVAPFDTAWRLPSSWAWGLMTVSAACLFVANTAMIWPCAPGEMSVIAPFRYVMVPMSILLGYWFWGDIPDALASIGIGLVLAAGLYTLHRERRG